ncbi:MAG: hypothetical protein NUW09_06290 [Deltaproteobacteria bacterium]|nr:hypothetical protein [Deltaproteobacteria bacterium]
MLEIVYGQTKKFLIAQQLVDAFSATSLNGTLYIGYPVLSSVDEKIEVDALLVSQEHGLIAFQFGDGPPRTDESASWEQIHDNQDKL